MNEKHLKSNRNGAITYLRVLAMLGIFTDHAVSYMHIPFGAVIIQITNSFVLLFLLLSGFLYGNRKITDFKSWYKKRCIAILIPFWIFLTFYYLVDATRGNFHIKAIATYVFNLQGILGTENGPGTLWFLTLLFMCYALVPLLQKIKEKINGNKKLYAILFLVWLMVQLLLAFFSTLTLDFGHHISWYMMAWFIFSFGYFISKHINQHGFTNQHFLIALIFLPVSLLTRLIAYKLCDGTLLYNYVIAIYANVTFNISLFVVVYYLYFFIIQKYGHVVQSKLDNRFISYFDKVSFHFYLVHSSVLSTLHPVINNQYVFVLISFVITILLAHLLKILADKAQATFKH